MYDYRKLKGRIVERFNNQRRFSREIGRSEVFVSQVLNSKAYLDQTDIDEWCKVLEIDPAEIGEYFFAH